MANNEVPFFNSSEWEQKHLEEILKNPPKPVSFTYTVDQLRNIYSNFTPVVDNTPGPRYIEDYYEFNEEPKPGDVNKFINSIYEFYSLENKNDLSKVESIYNTIIHNSYDIQLPSQFWKAEQEISNHLNYLRDMRAINEYSQEKERIKLQQEKDRIQQKQQLKEQQISPVERMNNFFNSINGSEPKNNNQQQEVIIAQQSQPVVDYKVDSYDNFENADLGDTSLKPEQSQQDKEQIEQLKVQISNYDSQIESLLASMQPYMQIPKVNREISKVIEKNNEINSSQIIDSLNDYKTVVEIKQSLVTFLEQANKFINDNIGKQQDSVAKQQVQESVQSQTSTQSLSNDFPKRIYNDDGTYTTEYINYVSNTPSGFNKEYYDKLMKENEFKKKQNEDPTSLLNDSSVWSWINDEEQMSSGGRHM